MDKRDSIFWVLSVSFFVCLCQLAGYGIDFGLWKIYSFAAWRTTEEYSNFDLTLSMIKMHTPFLRELYELYIAPIASYPFIYLGVSLLVRTILLSLIYSIFRFFTDNRYQALATLMLFAFGQGLVGHGNPGFFTSPLMFVNSIAAFLFLSSILFVLRKHFFLSAIPFGLAVHFHSLYTLSIFPPLVLGLLLWIWQTKNWGLLKGLVVFSLVSGSVAATMFLRIPSPFNAPNANLTLEAWHNFLLMRDTVNMTMVYTLGITGSGLLLTSLFYSFLHKSETQDKMGESLFLSCLVFFSICLIWELAHIKGLFFGKFSELFITIQFRRAFWFASLFLLPLLVKNIDHALQEKKQSSLFWFWISVGTAMICRPSIPIHALFFVLSILILLRQKEPFRKVQILSLLFIVFAFLCLYFLPDFAKEMEVSFKTSIFILAICAFSSQIIRKIHESNLKLKDLSILAIAFSFPITFSVYKNIFSIGFVQSISRSHDFWDLKITDYDKLTRVEFQQEENAASFNFADEDEFIAWKDSLTHIKNIAEQREGLLVNPLYKLDSRQYAKKSILFFEDQDRALANFSFNFAKEYDQRLREAFGHGLDWFYQDKNYKQRFNESFNALDKESLIKINKNFSTRYFLSKESHLPFHKVYANHVFSVYDLGSIQ